MNAKINNVIYRELYSGAKMVDDKYEETNVAGSIDREFTVIPLYSHCYTVVCFSPQGAILREYRYVSSAVSTAYISGCKNQVEQQHVVS
jgi:hypothetical protein